MALSYSNFAGHDQSKDRFQIALDGNQKIYYVDEPINVLKDYDEEEAGDLVTDLVDQQVSDLKLFNLSTGKLYNLDNDILANDAPTNRYEKRVYSAVKDELASMESKYYQGKNKLQVIPRNIPEQRDAYYIFGQAGCGKSTWSSNYALAYKRENPNNNVYIFSRKNYDSVFDDRIPGLIRVLLDRTFVRDHEHRFGADDPIEQYANSLVIFDDFLKIEDKFIRRAVEQLKNSIYELGRQHNTDILSIQHKGLGGPKSITELCESTGIVCFPKMNIGESMRLVDKYLCFTKEQMSRIFNEEARSQRWLCIIRPNIVITENYIKVID